MEIFTFDRAEHAIERYASTGAAACRIPLDRPATHATCLTIAPGGTIGRHPAPVPQLLLVIAGEGWVAGEDDRRVPVAAGSAVRWAAGEQHTSGSDTGLTAVALEG